MCAGTYAILSPPTTQSRVRGVRRGACVQAPMQFSLLGIELIVCVQSGNLLILAVHTCTCAVPDTQQVSGGPHITVLAVCFFFACGNSSMLEKQLSLVL